MTGKDARRRGAYALAVVVGSAAGVLPAMVFIGIVFPLFVRPEPDEKIPAGTEYEAEGVAFDGGSGISKVEISADQGKSWSQARLGPDLGKYSWRRWRFDWRPQMRGNFVLVARATNAAGETQVTEQWNRSGYQRNVIERIDVTVV